MNKNIMPKENAADDTLLLDRRENPRFIKFLGVDFAILTPETLLERVTQKASGQNDYGYLVTPNVDHLVRLDMDNSLLPYYEDAWLNVCDSRIVEVLAKFSGFNLPACPGSDLSAQLFDKIITKQEPINIIGADEEIIIALKSRYGVENINHYQPPMGLKSKPDEVKKCADFIANNQARFHFICVGSPQQEMVAKAVLEHKNASGIGLCLGASLDFLAGKTERAPIFIQKARLEWLHRLISEPKRMWRRYLIEGPKIFMIWQKWKKSN